MLRGDAELRKENRRVLKAEIRNYHISRKILDEDIADQASLGCYYPENDADMIRGCETSDPTSRRAVKLMMNLELRERKRRLDAIERCLSRIKATEPDKYRLVDLFYWSGKYTPEGVQQKLCISQNTFLRWNKDVLESISESLGWYI